MITRHRHAAEAQLKRRGVPPNGLAGIQQAIVHPDTCHPPPNGSLASPTLLEAVVVSIQRPLMLFALRRPERSPRSAPLFSDNEMFASVGGIHSSFCSVPALIAAHDNYCRRQRNSIITTVSVFRQNFFKKFELKSERGEVRWGENVNLIRDFSLSAATFFSHD